MTNSAALEASVDDPTSPIEPVKFGHWTNGLIAFGCWLVGMLFSAYVVHRLHLDPLRTKGVVFPVAAAAVGLLIVVPIVWRFLPKFAAPIAVGGFGAWLGMVMMQALYGTPFGYLGLQGDAAWMTATVQRYSTTAKPVDPFDPTIPAEYPPLYHWTLGRLAVVLHMPAWQMMKYGEIVLISLVPVLAYILWQRLVSPALAVVLAVAPQMVFSQPLRPYEVVSLATVVPWAIGAFVERPGKRGRALPWWAAGIIGGIYFQLYMGYLLFLAPGLIALVIWSFWRSENRRRFVLHMVGLGAVAVVTASWFLLAFLDGVLNYGGDRVSDYWVSVALSEKPLPLPFLGTSWIGIITLIGLFGIAFYWRTMWWAKPFAMLAVGTVVYQAIFLTWFTLTGHTGFVHYVIRASTTVLLTAGLLTITQATPTLFRKLQVAWRPSLPIVAAGVVVLAAGTSLWGQFMPAPYGFRDAHLLSGTVNHTAAPTGWNAAFRAHAEPLPNGSMPKYAAPGFDIQPYPVADIERYVAATLGPTARPRTLASDTRFFAFIGWPGFVGPGRTSANTFIQWDWRNNALKALSHTTTAAAFTTASQHLSYKGHNYGAIDCFVLSIHGGRFDWSHGVRFNPSLFDPTVWSVYQNVGELNNPAIVVIVRRHLTN